MGADNEEKKEGGEEEQKPITAGYRPLWGQHGLLALFWTLITFPLGFLGLLLLSPMFILVIILSLGLFVGGAVMIELEQRDPRVGSKFVWFLCILVVLLVCLIVCVFICLFFVVFLDTKSREELLV